MRLHEVGASLSHMLLWRPVRRRTSTVGATEVEDARRLADAERSTGGIPDGCAWLDERTVGDLDLPLVFRTIDRTVSPTGAQALWRWLVAPAVRVDVLDARERGLARFAGEPSLRDRVREALGGQAAVNAAQLPRLLWDPTPRPFRTGIFGVLAVALLLLAVLATWWPSLLLWCGVLFAVNVWVDDWASLRRAPQAHALGVLAQALAAAERVRRLGAWPDGAEAEDLAAVGGFRRRVGWLTVSDPFGLAELLRGGLLLRLLLLGGSMRVIERERVRLRRIVLRLGELDALVSVASLRAERADARVPHVVVGRRGIATSGLVHPAIAGAVGNDVVVDAAGLIVTGSNMAGKSTFLRTIAINAICAQSIHTTFGGWHAGLFRVFAVMRTSDETAAAMSTYAVQVAAIGKLVAAASAEHVLPALLAIDEPFSGTNPALRVPIAVAVLDFVGKHHLVITATHDLDVAAQADPRFVRGYFREPDLDTGQFDYRLQPGIAPTSNALALLARAGYPAAIITAVERRIGTAAVKAS